MPPRDVQRRFLQMRQSNEVPGLLIVDKEHHGDAEACFVQEAEGLRGAVSCKSGVHLLLSRHVSPLQAVELWQCVNGPDLSVQESHH